MLRIDDIDLYIRMNNSFTDESLNAYSITNTGNVGFGTGRNGLSNMAGVFNSTSKQLTLSSSAGNKLAISMNNGASIVYTINITNLSTTRVPMIHWGSTNPDKSFYNYISTNGNLRFGRYLNGDINPTPTNAISTNTWYSVRLDFDSLDYDSYNDNNANSSGTFSGNAPESATGGLKIGGDTSQPLTLSGSMQNFIAFNRQISSLEEKFINKFLNIKRCA